jgi:hypothetical protein
MRGRGPLQLKGLNATGSGAAGAIFGKGYQILDWFRTTTDRLE